MDRLLSAMKAAAEPTWLRLLVLCAHADLTVTDLVHILGQSHPRLSRHLKLLAEAGLLDRNREGSWVYFRLAHDGASAALARTPVAALPREAPTVARHQPGVETGRARGGQYVSTTGAAVPIKKKKT